MAFIGAFLKAVFLSVELAKHVGSGAVTDVLQNQSTNATQMKENSSVIGELNEGLEWLLF